MWFNNLIESPDPGKDELCIFVRDLKIFLGTVLNDRENFGFLWEADPSLLHLAKDTYRFDIAEGSALELLDAIPKIELKAIRQHGLKGHPLRFKFHVINTIANEWEFNKGRLSIRAWFKKLIDAIDALLDSLIDAAGGAGGLIKEFKDALGSLA
ncbi:MAG: hypothetical protein KZQ96_23365 [Candidatus Thiodiazotropha sp. (ex Lucinoma borealis)]|nr:hypothetical protein [Candidatus Thiodiazotropha sp. (ex Lucinoma borealis)]